MAAVSGLPFDQAAFEAGITAAMQMGQPVSTTDRPVFYFETSSVANGPADGRGVPFDPDALVINDIREPVSDVLCAMEFAESSDESTRLGRLDESPLILTFLDAEYQKVKDAAYLTVGGMRYDYESYDGPYTLFTSSVWTTYWTAHGGKVSAS